MEVVKAVEIEGRGRALVASQSLYGGQIILTDSPILLYSPYPLSSSSHPPYCLLGKSGLVFPKLRNVTIHVNSNSQRKYPAKY